MGKSRRLAAVLVAVLAVGCAVVASPASAATLPQLLSVSVSANQVTAPGRVTLTYTSSSYAPIISATASFLSPDQRLHSVVLTVGTSGSGTLDLPDGVPNGPWTLARLLLSTSSYTSTASTVCAPSLPDPYRQCTSHMDFSAETVTVSGSNEDRSAPLISSVSPTASPVQPGNPVTISWADDEVHTVARVSLTFQNFDPHALSDRVTFSSPTGADLSTRQLVQPLKAFAFNGVYQLTRLEIQDNLGNDVVYLSDGTTRLSGGAVSPTSHTLNFSAITFTVTGSTQGLNPPQLTSLHVIPLTAPSTGPIQLDYTATSAAPPLTDLRVTYLVPGGTQTADQTYAPLSGSTLLESQYFGAHQLSEIQLRDSRGNILIYRRDGTTYNPITGAVGSHTLNFPQFDMTLPIPKPQFVGAWSTPSAATVRWNADDGGGAQSVQTQVTVNPGGSSSVVQVDPPYGPDQPTYTLAGLRAGVTYTVTLVDLGPNNVRSAPTQTTITTQMSDHIFSVGDDNEDGRDDLVGFNAPTSTASFYGRSGSGYSARTYYGGWLPIGHVTPAGDAMTNGRGGVFYVDQHGTLTFLMGEGYGMTSQIQPFGTGWDSMRFLAGGFDFTGDGAPDLYAISSTGSLYLYPIEMVPSGLAIHPRQFIGSGWAGMQAVFSPGDFNGDHNADLMAVDLAGNLWLYPGNGHGGFAPRVLVGTGWGGFGAVFALRNFSGNGHMDVGAVDLAGNFYRYAGTGTGRFLPGHTLLGTGWNTYF